MNEVDLIDFKRQLRNDIFRLYKQRGYKHAILSIQNLIENALKKSKQVNDKSLAIQVRGECCELLLELQIIEYIRLTKVNWIVSKGLCVQRTDNKARKTTELDLTLFTPAKIVLFESKYRQGQVQLTDECTIVPKFGAVTDVYKQNIMHLTNLKNYFSKAILTLQGVKPFSITLYMESLERVTDLRSSTNKKLIRLLAKENLVSYLDELRANLAQIWDMSKVREIILELDSISNANMIEHMEGVKKHGH